MAIESPLFQSSMELLGHSITHFNGMGERPIARNMYSGRFISDILSAASDRLTNFSQTALKHMPGLARCQLSNG